MKKNCLIYVVEDDPPVNELITKFLEKQGFQRVKGFSSSEDMMKELPVSGDVIIIQDYDLPGMNGLQTISEVKTSHPKAEFIFLSGQRNIDTAVEAMKFGAFDYIVKDSFAKENVVSKVKNLLKIKSLEKERLIFKRALILFSILLFISWVVLLIEFFIRL